MSEFKTWCEEYQLSVEDAAIVLGISRATAFRYANEDYPLNKTASRLCKAIDLLSPKERENFFDMYLL